MMLSKNTIIISITDAYILSEMLNPIFQAWLLSKNKKMTDEIRAIDKLRTILRELDEGDK